MEEHIIYVAGNPDLYPIEYYDEKTESFQGVIPKLFEQFSKKTGYDVRYYDTGGKDRRAKLAGSRQVDVISGCKAGDSFSYREDGEIILIETKENGRLQTYRLLLTDAAPESLKEDLSRFLAQTSQEEMTGMVLEQVQRQQHSQSAGQLFTMLELVLVMMVFGGVLFVLISRYRNKLMQMRQEKETDTLTRIGNMEYLTRQFSMTINERNRILYTMYYFYIDAERITRMSSRAEMNELLGFMAGVLSEQAEENDILARVSEGSFVLLRLSTDVKEKSWFVTAIRRTREFAGSKGLSYVVDIAVGIYQLQESDWDLDEILFYAGQSAQAAYQEGIEYKTCDKQFLQTLTEERMLQLDIEQGLKFGRFHLYLRYYADVTSRQVIGAEALPGWEHPEKGFLTPDRFVPLMEREGLISSLEYYLLDHACAFLAKLHGEGVDGFTVAFRFSARTVSASDFALRCAEILDKYSFPRESLLFSFAESTMMKNREVVKINMEAAKAMGIRTALDDFGEGFLSLLDVQEYPVDVLKLSKSLISKLGTTMGNAIVRAMIQVGHELGMASYAEGVETDEQIRILSEMHCDMMQDLRSCYFLPSWEVERTLLNLRSF